MIIKTAEFTVSNSDLNKCPKDRLPEYAFVGRSNVGKSSLINMLTKKKKLAKTSATPGKTKLINHFKINNNWYIVDLPGYGYAQTSKREKQQLSSVLYDYLSKRTVLINTFLLIDSRHEPQKIDMTFMEWLSNKGLPFSIVFTKYDKLTKVKGEKNIKNYCQTLLNSIWEELPPYFITSSPKRVGRDKIIDYIENLNKQYPIIRGK